MNFKILAFSLFLMFKDIKGRNREISGFSVLPTLGYLLLFLFTKWTADQPPPRPLPPQTMKISCAVLGLPGQLLDEKGSCSVNAAAAPSAEGSNYVGNDWWLLSAVMPGGNGTPASLILIAVSLVRLSRHICSQFPPCSDDVRLCDHPHWLVGRCSTGWPDRICPQSGSSVAARSESANSPALSTGLYSVAVLTESVLCLVLCIGCRANRVSLLPGLWDWPSRADWVYPACSEVLDWSLQCCCQLNLSALCFSAALVSSV
jgi:hypothetical protein